MKRFLIIILTVGLLVASGCTKTDDITYTTATRDNTSNKNTADSETTSNLYFFKSGVTELRYKGTFLFDDIVEKDVKLSINELARLKNDKLYELKLNPVEGIPEDRLNLGYFYVRKDKIYKLEPTKENLDKLMKSEELPESSVIVCQDTEIKDALDENEPGFHHYLEVKGDRREYHSYNSQVSTGYYESFTWEKGKGLVNYQSGLGAERDSIEIFCECSEQTPVQETDNTLVTEEEKSMEQNLNSNNGTFLFGADDICLNKNPLINSTYSQILEDFGKPVEVKSYKVNPPATEPDYFYYYKVLVYDGFEVEVYLGEGNRELQDDDTIFRFDITGKDKQLDCGLKPGMTVEEVSEKFKVKAYRLADDEENSEIISINHVLKSYKPENLYSDYKEAMIIHSAPEKFEEPLAKALVLLIKDGIVERIVFGYPTAD